jgi:hypothetical protein
VQGILAKICRRIASALGGSDALSQDGAGIQDRIDRHLLELHESFLREIKSLASAQESFFREMAKFTSFVGYHHPAHFPMLDLSSIMLLQISDYCERNLFQNPKYKLTKRITQYQKKIYSVKSEDGIIEEIFNRIGTTDRSFVEFGVGHKGEENNSLYLLLKGWSGLWIEGSEQILSDDETGPPHLLNYKHVLATRRKYVSEGRLRIINAYVSAENVEELFDQGGVKPEIDLVSVDVDGNDYWVWKAIRRFTPRVVCIEYNSNLGDTVACAKEYDPHWRWDGSTVFGASLTALEKLGREKNYALVGCDFLGMNAYFVRNDLLGDHFEAPFTVKNHFEPNRVFLAGLPGNWHTPGVFVDV